MKESFQFPILWLAGFAVFTVIDLIWIGVIAAPIYRNELGLLLAPEMTGPRVVAALATWLVITFALAWFVLPRPDVSWAVAVGRGALLGFVLYAVYDLTNFAVIQGWTLKVTLVDIAWGTAICAVVTALMKVVQVLLEKGTT